MTFDQELAARSLGASRAYALWTVTVPQVKFSIQTGAFSGLHHVARRGGDFDAGLGRGQRHDYPPHVQFTA